MLIRLKKSLIVFLDQLEKQFLKKKGSKSNFPNENALILFKKAYSGIFKIKTTLLTQKKKLQRKYGTDPYNIYKNQVLDTRKSLIDEKIARLLWILS